MKFQHIAHLSKRILEDQMKHPFGIFYTAHRVVNHTQSWFVFILIRAECVEHTSRRFRVRLLATFNLRSYAHTD